MSAGLVILRLPFCVFCLCYEGLVTIVVSRWGRGYFASSFAAMQMYFVCCLWRLLIRGDIRNRFLAMFWPCKIWKS